MNKMKEGYIDKYGNITSYSLEDISTLTTRYILAYSLKEDTLYLDDNVILRSDFIVPVIRLGLYIFNQGIFRVVIYDLEKTTCKNISEFVFSTDMDVQSICTAFNITDKNDIRDIKKALVEYDLQ